MNKIKIYLRHSFYSPNSSLSNRKRPEWFDKKKIWDNFLRVTDRNICTIKIIYDSHFGDSSLDFFTDLSDDIELVKINCGTEALSFLETLKIIASDNNEDDTIIYFLEDDYLHREGWENVMIEGLGISDYISLYDHLDKYLDYPDLKSKILISNSTHWRTVPSTCNTYACRWKTLKEDFEIHKYYSINCHEGVSSDNSKFIHLESINRSLITPMPGYSTHCDYLQSPVIDWEKYIN